LHEFHARRLAEPELALPEGEAHVAGTVDFGCMTPLLAAFPSVPVEQAKGRVDLELDYRRESGTALPTLSGRVRTHDLEVVEKREAKSEVGSRDEAIQAAPSVYRGIDFGVDLALDAAARRLTAHLGFYDDRAELLAVDAAAGPWPDGPPAAVLARLSEIPLEVRAVMPTRKLAQLPPPLRPSSLRGKVAADATFQGSLADPHLVVDVRASRLSAATGARIEGEVKPRLAVIGHAEYGKQGGKLAVIADAQRSRALDVELTWSGDALRAATDEEARASLVVKARAVVDGFDLDTIPALKNRQLEGVLSGTLDLDYGPEKRAVRANLVAHPLRAGPATFDRLNVAVDAAPGHLSGAVDVDGQSGSLRASVASGLAWPARGVPSVSGDSVAKLSARRFRLAGLWPLVGGQVSELDGRLDADLGARVQGSKVSLTGSGRLTDGVVQIPAVGQRFEAISARIDVQPSAIVIADLRASGVTGQLQGNARLELDEHLALHRLDTTVAIAKNHKLPITVEGVAIGDAWGRVEAHVVNEPQRVSVRIGVPELHLEVPETDREGIQDLAADESVRVGVRRADAVFTALPMQPLEEPTEGSTPIDVSVELGSVWVKKGELVDAELTGALHIAVREEALITGRIDLKGGSLDVSGKRFEIERGTVTFTGGDPANPTVSATARWDAPAGYAVFATYAGTAKKGKLTLSAEPPLSQDEIVNLILFGTPEGSVASGSGGTAAGAVGLAGSTAARGLNRAISDLTRLDIQARVDTSTGVARPELMVPVTRRLSARVTRAIGEPSPGASPDRTFLTLELRLKRGWALSALLGDRGASALDLVWRKHY
jgi:translocation and assembly module TamB